MAKSLLKTVIDSSRAKTEEREKTKRAELRHGANKPYWQDVLEKDAAASAKKEEIKLKAELKAKMKADEDFQRRMSEVVFDIEDIDRSIKLLSYLDSELNSLTLSHKTSSEQYNIVLSKLVNGLDVVGKALTSTNNPIQDGQMSIYLSIKDKVQTIMQEAYKKEYYLSYQTARADTHEFVEKLEKFIKSPDIDKPMLLDAAKCTYAKVYPYISVNKAGASGISKVISWIHISKKEKDIQPVLSQYISLLDLIEIQYLDDADFSKYLQSKSSVANAISIFKIRKYVRIGIIILLVIGFYAILGILLDLLE